MNKWHAFKTRWRTPNNTSLKDRTACVLGGAIWFKEPCGHKMVKQALTTSPWCIFFVVMLTAILESQCFFQLFSSSPAQHKSQRGGLILHTVFNTHLLTQLPPYLPTYFFLSIRFFSHSVAAQLSSVHPDFSRPPNFYFYFVPSLLFHSLCSTRLLLATNACKMQPTGFATSICLYICLCNDSKINSHKMSHTSF